jgi:hypothetical protein
VDNGIVNRTDLWSREVKARYGAMMYSLPAFTGDVNDKQSERRTTHIGILDALVSETQHGVDIHLVDVWDILGGYSEEKLCELVLCGLFEVAEGSRNRCHEWLLQTSA